MKVALLLVGGGHTHVQLIKSISSDAIDMLLVDRYEAAWYSGVVPGLVAGDYSPRQCLIDLPALCSRSSISFVQGEIKHLDSEAKTAIVQDASGAERRVQFQFLSFNIGSTTYPPASLDLKVLSTRPIQTLYSRLQVVDAQLQEKAQENSLQILNVCIVGGGVAGVEMALCLFQRWNRCSELTGRVRLHIVHSHERVASELPECVSDVIHRALQRMDPPAAVHLGSRASSIAATDVVLEDGSRVPADAVVWACGGQPQTIPGRHGFGPLRLSDDGFVLVDSYLSSVSHPWVFAAGDCMAMERTHVPKAGVFAVRAAAPLTTTLTALLRECSSSQSASAGPPPLRDHLREEAVRRCIARHGKEFKPQMEFLRLLNMGDRTALGTKFGIWFRGAWVWRLKDYIDQSFLDSFRPEGDRGGDTGGGGSYGGCKGGECTANHTAGSRFIVAAPAQQYDDMLATESQTVVARMSPLAGAWVLQMSDADWLAKCGAGSSDVPQSALGMEQHIVAFSVLKRMAHDADWCNAVVQEVRRIQPPV